MPFPFHLSGKDLTAHKHVMGKTQSGKSKLLAHMAASLIEKGQGVSVIDPAGDLVTDIVGLLYFRGFFKRPDAWQKLQYINFSDPQRFFPFNILKQPYDTATVSEMLVDACRRIWPESLGEAPLFETIMRASLPVLIANNLPLPLLHKFLTDKPFRERCLQKVRDQRILAFFHNEFDHWSRDQIKMVGSTTRRTYLLSDAEALRYCLGQENNLLPVHSILDENQSVLYDIGGLRQETQSIFGCLLMVLYEHEILHRAQYTPEQRTAHQLIIDEAFQFLDASEKALTRLLALCAKYGLTLTLCHQNWSQFTEKLQGAMQNTIPIIFKMGGIEDARWAAPIVGTFDPYQVKEVMTKTQKDLATTTYFSEQYEVWARSLLELKTRQAYIKTSDAKHAIKIITTKMHDVQPYLSNIAVIKEVYAQKLLTPRARVQAYEQQAVAPIISSSAVSRKTSLRK
ncbi:hypothetical protein KSF_084070 [Reticulibacter mediterranei]|uniref:Type IV secretion system coupling protein TraD DNA-binding domain-containing protein n=1 Tax=Reticulibacter mediterranei TaxID=2778369 RepID=A0A8J3IUZ6_9CHLR|nr:hypothetical protein KSF_084070 [Reticulibacter mediterranei]